MLSVENGFVTHKLNYRFEQDIMWLVGMHDIFHILSHSNISYGLISKW